MNKVYEMFLADSPFNLIKNQNKRVEMRLNKNGRDQILPGDRIVFTHQESHEKLICEVVSVSKFKTFEELYENYDKAELGYNEDETAHPDDMLIYYKKEDIIKYGVLAIEIRLIS